jgi:branched-chain amino acid transport system permease protein
LFALASDRLKEPGMQELLQLAVSGLTVGAIYALVALGFTIIYNASDVVNFAQGEFVMLGGMSTIFITAAGVPLPLAAVLAVLVAILVGLALHRLAIDPAKDASTVTLIIITIGASILIRGVAQIVFDKQIHRLTSFSGDTPLKVDGVAILPQTFWILGGTAVLVVVLGLFFERTLTGKAILATAANSLAAKLVGINTRFVVSLSFALSAAIGAIGGILAAPITFSTYDMGTLLALKGFAAAMLGGIGSPVGAVAGGLLLGLLETFSAGYISSAYKDGVAFIVILAVLFVMPAGLFGHAKVERV